jgi:hypothetical protein
MVGVGVGIGVENRGDVTVCRYRRGLFLKLVMEEKCNISNINLVFIVVDGAKHTQGV